MPVTVPVGKRHDGHIVDENDGGLMPLLSVCDATEGTRSGRPEKRERT
jgi:hypothetical protein